MEMRDDNGPQMVMVKAPEWEISSMVSKQEE